MSGRQESYVATGMNGPPENPVVYFPFHWFDPMIPIAHIVKLAPWPQSSRVCLLVRGDDLVLAQD